jgi:molybdopterin converting factor small subunit
VAVILIPALLRPLAGGAEKVRANGATLRDVIDDLERQHPGLRERILDGASVRPEIALAVGGTEVSELNTSVGADDEVHILPAIAGG